MQDSFGMRIRLARKACGVKQYDLAHRIGLTAGAFNQIELGKSAVFAERVRDVAQALNVDARYLLGLKDEMFEGQN